MRNKLTAVTVRAGEKTVSTLLTRFIARPLLRGEVFGRYRPGGVHQGCQKWTPIIGQRYKYIPSSHAAILIALS